MTVEFRPAPAHSGITFVRSDLPSRPCVPAAMEHRTESPRRTSIRRDDAAVEMIEHIMAALWGLQIDNCEVRVNQAEMPGMDGSAIDFVAALDAAGIRPQSAWRDSLAVTRTMRVADDGGWIQIEPADTFRVTYQLDYAQHPQIGRQTVSLEVNPDSFRRELATARTFLLKHEAEQIRQQGRGSRAGYQDLLVFGASGPIDNALRFENECARHKALDVVGDFALCGFDLSGHITAHRSGHRLNGELARQLFDLHRQRQHMSMPTGAEMSCAEVPNNSLDNPLASS